MRGIVYGNIYDGHDSQTNYDSINVRSIARSTLLPDRLGKGRNGRGTRTVNIFVKTNYRNALLSLTSVSYTYFCAVEPKQSNSFEI